MEPYNTFDAFVPHFNALARVGYFKRLDDSNNKRNFVHGIFMKVVLFFIVLYNVQHVIKVILTRHSTDQMVDTLFVLLTTLSTFAKHTTFLFKSKRVDGLICTMHGALFTASEPAHVAILKSNAVAMKRLLYFNECMVFTCAVLWATFPIVNRALGFPAEFSAYFPFETNTSPVFELTLTYMSILITVQAYANVTMDCTVVGLFCQTNAQFRILCYNLQHVADCPSRVNTVNSGVYLDKGAMGKIIQKRYVRCIEHYKEILWFAVEVETVFASGMTVQITTSAWVICMTVYKMVDLPFASAEFFSMFMYLFCMLAQLFIYCYYGTKLQMQSEELSLSLYRSNWLSLSPSFRRMMLFTMCRSQRPVTPKSAYVVPLSLETYIGVLRLSYTLYTFLEKK